MKNKLFFLICFISLFAYIVNAQEPPETEEAANTLTAEHQRIEMEIRTSTLPELAALSRTLGLSESGTRDDLSRRLRQHYGLSETRQAAENQKVITVESAQTSEYFRIEIIDEEYARLRGDVRLNMKDGDNIHTISAQEILFNRTRNILTAKGGVVYIKTTSSDGTIETFRGENITVNIDDWSSVFLDGSSERKMAGEDTGYMFSGRVISRTGDDVTILNNASITNANVEESFWSITASRIWLLPGSDFAIFNAVLKVGELPMLYIPFLYYPVDELVFHPVIGSRSREGAFVQTTTYLLGRPKANPEEQNSITSILGGAGDMEKELQGIFLRSTGKKAVSVTEPSLRLLLDHYVNMGTFAGIEFSLPRTGILSQPIDLSLGLGYTRTISMVNGKYTPYGTNYDGDFDWNHSNFFSMSIPLRYRIHFKSGISMRYGSISWDLPYYSDPFVHRDFLENRSESLDYFELVRQVIEETFESASSTSSLGAPVWTLTANINPQVRSLNPFVTRASISTLSSTLTFRELLDNNISTNSPNSPTRSFFVPHIYTIYNISAAISGTPLSIGGQVQRTTPGAPAAIRNPLEGIGEAISPWEKENDQAQRPASDDILALPVLNQRFELPKAGDIRFNIDYSITPTSSSELQFMSGHGHWATAEDVDWNDVQSIITTVGGNTNINFNVNHSAGLFTNTVTFTGSGTWRDYTFINEEAPFFSDSTGIPDPGKVEDEKKKLYGFTRYNTLYTYNGTLRPLLDDPVFGQSNLQYNFGGTLVSSKRYTDGDGPELTPVWGSWVKEDISKDIYGLRNHRLATNLAANIMNKQQNITLGLDLPPLDTLISANATFRIWNSVTNVNFRIRQVAEDALERPGEWIYDPINITETITFGRNNFNFSMVIKPEENNDITDITSSLSLFSSSFTTSFSARKVQGAQFDLDNGRWDDDGVPVLQPARLAFTYNKSFTETNIITNLLSFSLNLNTSLNFDLIKHTNSNFTLTLGSTFKINNFLDVTLSATSSNSVIFRYFKNVPGMEDLTFMYPDGPQNNLFTDLVDSFNFFDESKRQRTGFKMGSFNLNATHHLGDWDAKFEIKIYPYLNQTVTPVPRYEVTTDISFVVQWKPISELKTDVSYEGQHDRWEIR